jgi:arsenate reductase
MPRTAGAPVPSTTATLVARLRALAGFGPPARPANLMPQRPLNVLVLCTGNPARAIVAEALLSHLGKNRLHAHAVSNQPTERAHPLALRVLAEAGIRTRSFYSRGWDEFARSRVATDVVITISDHGAEDTCPWLPGTALRAHWSMPDPAQVHGTEELRLAAFRAVFELLRTRIEKVAELVKGERDRDAFDAALQRIAPVAAE